MRVRALVLLAVLASAAAGVVTGCDAVANLGRPGAGPYPAACAEWGFPERQCRSIVYEAGKASGVDPAEISGIRLLPFEQRPTLGGGQIALVAFDKADGTSVEQPVSCAGVAFCPACHAELEIMVSDGLDRDVPCAGEPPAGCATVPPTPPPEALVLGEPLEIPSVTIAIDRLGEYRVELGAAVLPDGHLSERSLTVRDTRPDNYWISFLTLVVDSEIPGREPAGSIYREPFDGPEPVSVSVVFEVTELFEEDVLVLEDIVVR